MPPTVTPLSPSEPGVPFVPAPAGSVESLPSPDTSPSPISSETGSLEKLLACANPISGSTEKLEVVEKEKVEGTDVTQGTEVCDNQNETDPGRKEPTPAEELENETKETGKSIQTNDSCSEIERSTSSSEIIDKVRRRINPQVPSDVSKRATGKVPAPVRPVSLISNFGDISVAKKINSTDELDRVSTRNRSSSVSNRNRRRPSPPPLDRVLQIQATDKILNKNEVYGKKENSSHPRKEHAHDKSNMACNNLKNPETKGKSRKEIASNIVIPAGMCFRKV